MERKRWSDLSAPQRVMIGLSGLVQVVLLGAALWDLRRRPADLIRGNKKLWVGLVFINYVGPIAYFVFGRRRADAEAVLVDG